MSIINIRINVKDAKTGLRKLPDAVVRAVDPKLSRGAEEVARTARNNAPKAFSNLANSIRAEQVGVLHYLVGQNVAQYGRPVEEGSAPHTVDSTKLIPWVERVLGLRDKEAREKAFLIARAIRRRGTPPQPHMSKAAEAESWRVRELVLEGVKQGSREAFP